MNGTETFTVGISDCKVSSDEEAMLATHALGSCIALTIYDPVVRVAGLLHFMLPDSTIDRDRAHTKPYMFADTGIPLLFRTSYQLGAVKQRLVVSAAGAAQVLSSSDTFDIGKRNYLALRKILWKAGVMMHHEDIGGTKPRTVRMSVGTGRVVISHGREEWEITDKARIRGGQENGF
jgi:chemotaxis protein CheD